MLPPNMNYPSNGPRAPRSFKLDREFFAGVRPNLAIYGNDQAAINAALQEYPGQREPLEVTLARINGGLENYSTTREGFFIADNGFYKAHSGQLRMEVDQNGRFYIADSSSKPLSEKRFPSAAKAYSSIRAADGNFRNYYSGQKIPFDQFISENDSDTGNYDGKESIGGIFRSQERKGGLFSWLFGSKSRDIRREENDHAWLGQSAKPSEETDSPNNDQEPVISEREYMVTATEDGRNFTKLLDNLFRDKARGSRLKVKGSDQRLIAAIGGNEAIKGDSARIDRDTGKLIITRGEEEFTYRLSDSLKERFGIA